MLETSFCCAYGQYNGMPPEKCPYARNQSHRDFIARAVEKTTKQLTETLGPLTITATGAGIEIDEHTRAALAEQLEAAALRSFPSWDGIVLLCLAELADGNPTPRDLRKAITGHALSPRRS